MKSSSFAVASVLSAALILTGCSDDGEPGTTGNDLSTSTASEESGATSDAGATEDDVLATEGPEGDAAGSGDTDGAEQTDGPEGDQDEESSAPEGGDAAAGEGEGDDEVIEMTTSSGGIISIEDAEKVATKVLTHAALADQGDGREIRDEQRQAYMSTARQVAEAEDQLEAVFGAPEARDLDENPVEANVLAISRDDGQRPHYLLVQTVPEDSVPELHLMESRTGKLEHYRIVWEAPMLPGTKLPTFHPRSEGTPVLREGAGDLLEVPRDTLRRVAAYTSYPQPEEVPEFRTHGYSPAVRKAATAQAEAVAGQAELREKNWLISDDTRTLMFEDGSAFVIGALSRQTTFTVLPNSVLTPPDAFRIFQDSSSLSNEAVMKTVVFIGMRVPAENNEFIPEMIAVREQLVDASGT